MTATMERPRTRAKRVATRAERNITRTRKLRVAIYARISLDRRHAGVGVKRQEKLCRELCAAMYGADAEVVAVYVDNDTPASRKGKRRIPKRRPGYEALVSSIEADEVDVLMALHPDRVHRNNGELEPFIDLIERKGTTITTVKAGDFDLNTASGRTMARVVGAIAQGEVERQGERLVDHYRAAAFEGRPHGGRRAFGFEQDGITHRESEAATIRAMVAWLFDGMSAWGIADKLNGDGITTAGGKTWATSTVKQVLSAPRLAGLRTYHGEVVGPGAWEGIITRADHERVVAILAANARAKSAAKPSGRSYLLTGLVYCAACGASMTGHPSGGGRRNYGCTLNPGYRGCGATCIAAGRDGANGRLPGLDDVVIAAVLEWSDGSMLRQSKNVDEAVATDAARLEAKLDAIAADYHADRITHASWLKATNMIETSLAEARAKLARSVSNSTLARWSKPGSLRAAWDGLTFDERRAAIASIVDRIDIGPSGGRGRGFDPSRAVWRFRA